MGFQTAPIPYFQGLGTPGDLFDSGPHRAQPFNVVSALASYNVFGRGFSVTGEGTAAAGNAAGALPFAGIMVSSKSSVLFGVSGLPLDPTLTLPNNSPVALLTMGTIIVVLPAAAAIGDLVCYNNTTGILTTITPGSNLAVGTSFAYGIVDRFIVTAAGLAVIKLTDAVTVPVLA